MAIQTKLRLRKRNRRTEVMVLVNHPMDAGNRQDSKVTVQPHYIERLIYELNDKVVAEANMGPGVAANPLTSIALSQTKPGDRVRVRWIDNQGGSDSVEKLVR